MTQMEQFIESLRRYTAPQVYNPWRDFDASFDIGEQAPAIRCRQLAAYLRLRFSTAKYILVAEAIGYQGGHFSGIAMTSERILLGHHARIAPTQVLAEPGVRTSNPANPAIKPICREKGFNEPTATIVWDAIAANGRSAFEVVLWNIFPFHPYKGSDVLTNRTPDVAELQTGAAYLQQLQALYPQTAIIAIGAKSAKTLAQFAVPHAAVPHPANGGATAFRSGIAPLLGNGAN